MIVNYIVDCTPNGELKQAKLLGYTPDGNSFLFTQEIISDIPKDKRTIFCISRQLLEKILKIHPK